MISVLCFKWNKPGYRSTFTGKQVNILRDMVRRNTTVPHRFICITDDPRGIDPDIEIIKLWENPAPRYGNFNRPNCYVRLRCFDPEMSKLLGKKFIWLDLDTVILGNIDDILLDKSNLKLWRVDGERMLCNGSMVMYKSGTHDYIWKDFDITKICMRSGLRRSHGLIGSDQAWIAQYIKESDDHFGQKDGVYSFRCHIKEPRARLPNKAKIVFFHGRYDPWHNDIQRRYPWVKEHYQVKELADAECRKIETSN